MTTTSSNLLSGVVAMLVYVGVPQINGLQRIGRKTCLKVQSAKAFILLDIGIFKEFPDKILFSSNIDIDQSFHY
jgi:hypothetical protein